MPGSQLKENIFYMFRSRTQTNKQANIDTHKIIELNKVNLITSGLKFLYLQNGVYIQEDRQRIIARSMKLLVLYQKYQPRPMSYKSFSDTFNFFLRKRQIGDNRNKNNSVTLQGRAGPVGENGEQGLPGDMVSKVHLT